MSTLTTPGTGTQKKPNRIMSTLFVALRILLLVYFGLLLLLIVFQRKFIYYPEQGSERTLLEQATLRQLLPWRDSQGRLIGWKSAPSKATPRHRIIVFHGNAGYALDRLYFVQGLAALEDGKLWEVYLLEYPGYGARAGTTSEAAFMDAANAALAELRRDDDRPIYLLGESLGSGVAAGLAGQKPDQIAGLFLITPFSSLADVAAHQFPMFPVRVFLRERYASEEALKKYRGPVAVLLAGQDEVVPMRFGQRLFDSYHGPKRLWMQQENNHNTVDYDGDAVWWREVSDFLTAKDAKER